MSWNPFSRSSSAAPKKAVLSTATKREFEKEVKRLDELEELTRKLYKDGKKFTEASNALSKTERKMSQELLSAPLCQTEDKFKWLVDEWDASMVRMELHTSDRNGKLQKTVLDPLKKYVSIFPYAQVAVKKREQALQEFQKSQDKVSKYQERDRSGQNIVKLDASKKALVTAQSDFTAQNEALMTDIPKMVDSCTDYLQPSLEAYIKAQVQYTTEAVKVYGELANLMNGHKQHSRHDYASLIQQSVTELKALSITTD